MNRIIFTTSTILLAATVGACVSPPKTCGLPNEPVVIGTAKDGNLIYDDHVALSAPCVAVTPPNTSTPHVAVPPVLPPVEPPIVVASNSKHPNSGRGNGSEIGTARRDVDPGNSGEHNKGGD